MAVHVETVAFDARDAAAIGRWWADFLGWRFEIDDDGYVEVLPPEGQAGPSLGFFPVPEGKQVKNRVHLDLRPDDQEAEVARAEAMGARRVDVGQGDDPETSWVVLADPEGNEFCILRARPS